MTHLCRPPQRLFRPPPHLPLHLPTSPHLPQFDLPSPFHTPPTFSYLSSHFPHLPSPPPYPNIFSHTPIPLPSSPPALPHPPISPYLPHILTHSSIPPPHAFLRLCNQTCDLQPWVVKPGGRALVPPLFFKGAPGGA